MLITCIVFMIVVFCLAYWKMNPDHRRGTYFGIEFMLALYLLEIGIKGKAAFAKALVESDVSGSTYLYLGILFVVISLGHLRFFLKQKSKEVVAP